MPEAPKMMKQPTITHVERRTSMRPLSISNPTVAIARTAMVVAIVPVSAPSIHLKAAKTGSSEGDAPLINLVDHCFHQSTRENKPLLANRVTLSTQSLLQFHRNPWSVEQLLGRFHQTLSKPRSSQGIGI